MRDRGGGVKVKIAKTRPAESENRHKAADQELSASIRPIDHVELLVASHPKLSNGVEMATRGNNMFQPDLLKGKRVLITGGGTGLGKSMGRRMIEPGAELMICGRRAEVLKDTAKEFEDALSCKVRTHVIDIRSAEAVDGLMDAAFADGPLDVLVNNAAGNFIARTETLSHRAVDSILNIVLHGTAYCTLAASKRWIGQGHGGVVLSIVASYAWTGSPYVVPSAMAKAGVLAMTQSLAVEWGPKKIRTVAISPGTFPTP